MSQEARLRELTSVQAAQAEAQKWGVVTPDNVMAVILQAARGEPFRPNWRVHPGESLQEILDERNMSQSYLAWAMGYSHKHVNQVIKGHASITATFAVRLEEALGGPSAEFWMRYQTGYDLHAARESERLRAALGEKG